tara:strand:+ start:68 stop:655 length:588 start_codon:yes stop_codon:yes gene_type:complete
MADAVTGQLSSFKSALQYGGARSSLFNMTVYVPGTFEGTTMTGVGALLNTFHLQCNVSAIPPLTVTPIEKQYFGRTVKIPGDIVYGDLTTTVMNAEDYSVRNAIEKWMNKMNGHVSNKGFSNNTDWVTDLELIQYSKEGESLMYYEFIDCWPQTLAEIPLSYDTASDIEQFDVTWAYNYYTTGDVTDVIDNGNQG